MIKVIVIPVEKMVTRFSSSFGDSVILFTFGAGQTTTAIDFPCIVQGGPGMSTRDPR